MDNFNFKKEWIAPQISILVKNKTKGGQINSDPEDEFLNPDGS